MFIQPETFSVTPSGGLNRQLSITGMTATAQAGIIYRVNLEILDGDGNVLKSDPFAKVAITDAVRVRFTTPEQPEYVNNQITAQMWHEGQAGDSAKQGMQEILYICAASSGILPQ